MSTTHYPPPFQHLAPARPISSTEALANIQSYLEESITNAHLHPDCQFVEHAGPAFSGSSSLGGVVLQQLRRVEAGLRGVWMGVEPDFELDEQKKNMGDAVVPYEVEEEHIVRRKTNKGFIEARDNSARSRRTGLVDDEDEGVNEEDIAGDDVANYQEQLRMAGDGTLLGELGARSNAVGNRRSAPSILDTRSENARKRKHEDPVPDSRGLSKEERRAAKKARNKEDKATRAEQRKDGRGYEAQALQYSNGDMQTTNGDVAQETNSTTAKDTVDKSSRKAERRARRKAEKAANGTSGTPETNGVNEYSVLLDHEADAQADAVAESQAAQDEGAIREARKKSKKSNGMELSKDDPGNNGDDRTRRKAEKRARKLADIEHQQSLP